MKISILVAFLCASIFAADSKSNPDKKCQYGFSGGNKFKILHTFKYPSGRSLGVCGIADDPKNHINNPRRTKVLNEWIAKGIRPMAIYSIEDLDKPLTSKDRTLFFVSEAEPVPPISIDKKNGIIVYQLLADSYVPYLKFHFECTKRKCQKSSSILCVNYEKNPYPGIHETKSKIPAGDFDYWKKISLQALGGDKNAIESLKPYLNSRMKLPRKFATAVYNAKAQGCIK